MGFSDELTAPRAASNNRGRVAAALGLCALAACAWTGQQVALPHSGKGWLFTPASDALTPTPVDATALAGAHDANNPNRTHNTPEIVALKGQLTDLKAKEATLVPHSAEYQANRIDYVKVKDTLKPLLEARKAEIISFNLQRNTTLVAANTAKHAAQQKTIDEKTVAFEASQKQKQAVVDAKQVAFAAKQAAKGIVAPAPNVTAVPAAAAPPVAAAP